MKIIEIHSTLYRLYNDGKAKDIKFIEGMIVEPDNDYNILTEEEKEFVMEHLIDK